MPGPLTRIPFTRELLDKVQAFDCGSEPWQTEVSDWLKAPPGAGRAVDALEHGTEVWLYMNEQGELVGFGSLAESPQSWPRSKDPKIPASLIPWLAVDRRFWGQPPGPREDRYGMQIVRNLIHEAMRHRDTRPILKLLVYEGNTAAIRLYEHAGFVEFHKPWKDPGTGRLHKRMALVLADSPGQPEQSPG